MMLPLRFRYFVILTAMLVFGTLALGRPAQAGTLQVSDREHALSSDDTARLRSALAAAPFDGRFVVTSEYPDAQELSRYVGSLVTEPNVVVVGLDPRHHHVQVHFGNGTRISRSEWPAIERAGNDAFRRADWAGGAADIFTAASRVGVGSAADSSSASPVAAPRPSLVGPGLLLLILAGGIGLAVYFARRRASYGGMGGPGYGAAPFQGPGGPNYTGQAYPMPPQGGMGPLGGGLLGAGLGGLAGYELGKLEGEREERAYRDPGADRGGFSADRGDDYDAGGGGSSWDDGGGGDGGFDGGGGGDGGGGSDF